MSRTGRAVPLSLPLDSQNLRVLRSLRQNAATLQTRLEALEKLQSQLHELASRPQWEALVPVQGTSSLAYGSGRIVQTDKVMVNLGGGEANSSSEDDREQPADSGYWVEYTAEQAEGVALRKAERLQARLANMKSAIADCESSLSQEMGLQGGGVNQNYEVVNEEGLPFVDIQEFEDDDGVPHTLDASPPDMLSEATLSQLSGATSQYMKPRLAMQMPTLLKDVDEAVNEAKSPVATLAKPPKPTSPPVANHKKVSFTTETKTGSTTDQKLPVIGSTSALSPSPQKTAGTSGSRNAITSLVQERPMKGMIVEKDTTRPPPVLTAAERSVRSPAGQSEALSFDGVVSHKGKSVDMSAYLPRSIRGSSTTSRPDKGKGRVVDPPQVATEEAEEEELEPEADEGEDFDSEDDDDSDGLYQYDESDEDEDDNYHIDDILAMREAALQYHARRYDLGAGAGTGPLGGNKRPDEYDELGRLTAADKGGLPFVETFETTDGERPASKFRTGRLQTARMVIPDAPFESIDISKNVIPGDDLGPYEKEKDKEGQHGDHDFTGMSKEEIETFLRYVKALETGEDIDIIPAVRKDEKPVSDPQPAPPTVKSSQPPSVKTSIVEKTASASSGKPTQIFPSPDQITLPAETADKPKRVSRFRAAREGS